jgi:hypothetical protein
MVTDGIIFLHKILPVKLLWFDIGGKRTAAGYHRRDESCRGSITFPKDANNELIQGTWKSWFRYR